MRFTALIDHGIQWDTKLDRALEEGCRPRPQGTIKERVRELRVREWWLQNYVKHNPRKLGFTKIEGPFDAGPDFIVTYKNGKEVQAEVEVRWKNYVDHKHHTDPRFSGVGILIALEPVESYTHDQELLPKKLIRVDSAHFTKCYRGYARTYARKKEKEHPARVAAAKIRLITEEFHSRYVSNCGEKERNAAACPDCDVCPYFSYFGDADGISLKPLELVIGRVRYDLPPSKGFELSPARITFKELAIKFLHWRAVRDIRRFKLSDIKDGEFDRFLESGMADSMEWPG